MGIPNSCLSCEFESCCDSAMGLPGCKYSTFIKEKTTLKTKIKKLLIKLF